MDTILIREQIIRALWQSLLIVVFAAAIGMGFHYARNKSFQLIKGGQGESITVSLKEARRYFEKKGALFIDARDTESFNIGHIKGAKNIPFQDIDNYFAELTENTPSDTFIITYCDGSACNLSHELALFLSEMGFSNVKVLVNGWTIWQEAKLPVERVTY